MSSIPHSLLSKFEKEDPRVVIFVGAGVSIGATGDPSASWNGLLMNGIRYLAKNNKLTPGTVRELEKELKEAFEPFVAPAVLSCAQKIEDAFRRSGNEFYFEWLRTVFDRFKITEGRSDTLQAIRRLSAAGALIVTTNYDGLLSQVTGRKPVVWRNRLDVYDVLQNPRHGILHLHGYWEKPSSLVLGEESYRRIVDDTEFQFMFKNLWMNWTWLIVGCGGGLGDPNLSQLFSWAKRWKIPDEVKSNYLICKTEDVTAIERSSIKPSNQICVPIDSYDVLPKLLNSLTPISQCYPFKKIDEDFDLFSNQEGDGACVPSRKEYWDGEVPEFFGHGYIYSRLIKNGCCVVTGKPSIGKTTLALRLGCCFEKNNYDVCYIDLSQVYFNEEEKCICAFNRVLRSDLLIIIDNFHSNVSLMRKLFDRWRNLNAGDLRCKLLFVGTSYSRRGAKSYLGDMSFLKGYWPTRVKSKPEHFGSVFRWLYKKRTGEILSKTFLSEKVLKQWHSKFARSMEAFVIACSNRMQKIRDGDFSLEFEHAEDWVKEKWLKKLTESQLDNLIFISSFSTQQLQMAVEKEVLPFPHDYRVLISLGLVVEFRSLQGGQKLQLKEPRWGELILAASQSDRLIDELRRQACKKSPTMLVDLTTKCRSLEQKAKIWEEWSDATLDNFLLLGTNARFNLATLNVFLAEAQKQRGRGEPLWFALESHLGWFKEQINDCSLNDINAFLSSSKSHDRRVELFWKELESGFEKLETKVWGENLDSFVRLVECCKAHGRSAERYWNILESSPQKYGEWARRRTPIDVVSLLQCCEKHNRSIDFFWKFLTIPTEQFESWILRSKFIHSDRLINVYIEQKPAVPLVAEYCGLKPWEWSADDFSSTINGLERAIDTFVFYSKQGWLSHYFLVSVLQNVKWLKSQLAQCNLQVLSRQLQKLAFNSSQEVIQCSDCSIALFIRIKKEVATHDELYDVISLIGAASLCGVYLDKRTANYVLRKISRDQFGNDLVRRYMTDIPFSYLFGLRELELASNGKVEFDKGIVTSLATKIRQLAIACKEKDLFKKECHVKLENWLHSKL